MTSEVPALSTEWGVRSRKSGYVWSLTPDRAEAEKNLAALKDAGHRGVYLACRQVSEWEESDA